MKHLFMIILVAICSINIYAQQDYDISLMPLSQGISNNEIKYTDYKQTKEWGRYKTLRAVGWSAFGVGVPATLLGVCFAALEHGMSGGDAPIGAAVIAVGGTLTVASVPLLICAYRYRDKAKQMSVGLSTINTPTVSRHMAYDYAPALSVSVTF